MRSSNLPTTGFLAMLFKRLPYNRFYWTHTGHNGLSVSLPETQVNRANCQNISVVKNESFMRNKGPVFLFFFVSEHLWTAKIPCKERVRKYRVHKIGVFSEKNTVSEHLGCLNI